MAVLAISAAGAVIGGSIGHAFGAMAIGASIGWAIGSYIGSMLFTGPDIENVGPRLEDLTVQTSQYGAPIPDVFGAARIAGNLFWSTGLIETVTVYEDEIDGGIFGGDQEITTVVYSYSASFAIGLCEGEIQGIGRIWLDSKLFLDFRTLSPQQARDEDVVTIYLGTESQTADSTIQSYVGAADTPAYRGLAYLVFNDLQLADYSNHIPNVTVEIFEECTSASGGILVGLSQNNESYVASSDDLTTDSFTEYDGQTWNTHTPDMAFGRELGLFVFCDVSGVDRIWYSSNGSEWTAVANPPSPLGSYYGICWSSENEVFVIVGYLSGTGYVATSLDGTNWTSRTPANNNVWRSVCYSSDLDLFVAVASAPGSNNRVMTSDDSGQNWTERTSAADNSWRSVCWSDDLNLFCAVSDTGTGNRVMTSPDGITWTIRTSAADLDWRSVIWGPDAGVFVAVAHESSGTNLVMTSPDGITWTQRTHLAMEYLKKVIWVDSISKFIAVGALGGFGGAYYIHSSDGINWTRIRAANFANPFASIAAADASQYIYNTTNYPTHAEVVTKLCTDAGLTSGDLDVTNITDTLHGYVRANVMPARRAIEPILFSYLYDVAEIDKKLEFVPRGGSSIAATILSSQLAASDENEAIDTIVSTRAEEIELPQKLEVKFLHTGRGHEVDTRSYQYFHTDSSMKKVVDIPIAMTATEAINIAYKLISAAWTANTRYQFQTTTEFIYLTPTDLVIVGDDSIRMRIVSMSISNGIINFEAASEYNTALLTSNLTTTENDEPAESTSEPGVSKLKFFDCPAFNSSGDNAGFYIGAYSLSSNWNGCTVYISSDGGNTFAQLAILPIPITYGTADDILGDSGDGLVWDNKSTVTVTIDTPGKTLSSSTETNVLNGANAALLGNTGKWEIIQFVDVVDNGNGNYTLSKLLRGRHGTEWAMSQHAVGDIFVMINSAMARINLGNNAIGLSRTYRATSIGALVQSATTYSFTMQAVSLECFTVVHVRGTRDGSDNLTITWIRRDRIDGEWRDNVDVSLSEDNESYEIEIMDGANVKRTLTATSPTVTYTAAQQTTDFGSTQSSVDIKIYQMSAAIGRGRVKEATV